MSNRISWPLYIITRLRDSVLYLEGVSRLEGENRSFVDNSQAKQPVVDYNEIDIQLPLRQTAETDAAAV